VTELERHVCRAGPHELWGASDEQLAEKGKLRKHIEPWLSSVFQSEHLSVILGSGFTNAVALAVDGKPATMQTQTWGSQYADVIAAYASTSAQKQSRGAANIEDQLRTAIQLKDGLEILGDEGADELKAAIDDQLRSFVTMILETESTIAVAEGDSAEAGRALLLSFLLSFASRTASRERVNLFTTNYDRLIEYGCDLAGLRPLDRFIGALEPAFRASRLDVDMHYNPPGIRGEPRYLEGVVKLCKLHGSLDWRWNQGVLSRCPLPFGADATHPAIPPSPSESVIIYPNPAKDVETLEYPYAELFRDFASCICRPNSALVTYGYGFGDDHVNRTLLDMLTIPSTHLVIIAWDSTNPEDSTDEANASRHRINSFLNKASRPAQISLLLGSHFGDLQTLVSNYLPKPAIDPISIREAHLRQARGEVPPENISQEGADDATN